MKGQTTDRWPVTRLRAEGRAVVFSIPAGACRELAWKSGDLVIVKAINGTLIAVKVDLQRATEMIIERSKG